MNLTTRSDALMTGGVERMNNSDVASVLLWEGLGAVRYSSASMQSPLLCEKLHSYLK